MNDLKFTTAGDYMNDANDIVAKLEKQCWSHRVNGTLVDGQLHFDTKKFAELIARECIKINTVETIALDLPEYNLGMLEGYRRARENISIHFGVEK